MSLQSPVASLQVDAACWVRVTGYGLRVADWRLATEVSDQLTATSRQPPATSRMLPRLASLRIPPILRLGEPDSGGQPVAGSWRPS